MGRGEIPGPVVEEGMDQSKPELDFVCVQGNIEGERRERDGGLIEVKMHFFTFNPDPSAPRRKSFHCLAIMTEEEYSGLLSRSGAINPENPMGFIDYEDDKSSKFVITPKAKKILDEEEKTKEAVAESSRQHEQVQDPPNENGDEVKKAS